jgi:hypothetical protein
MSTWYLRNVRRKIEYKNMVEQTINDLHIHLWDVNLSKLICQYVVFKMPRQERTRG